MQTLSEMVQGSMFQVQGFTYSQLFTVCNQQSAVLCFLLPTADCPLPIFKVYSHHSAICNFFLLIAYCLLPNADFYKSK
jgi:hypothetical protein